MFEDKAVIVSYTRAEALEDGVLIDVTPLALKAGINLPVAFSEALHKAFTADDLDEKEVENGIYHLLEDLAQKARGIRSDRIDWTVQLSTGEEIDLYALVHGGDHGEPVITIMLYGED